MGSPKHAITVRIENAEELMAKLHGIEGGTIKSMRYTVKDIKNRAPGWISSEIVKVYNIKKSETMNPKISSGKSDHPVSIKIRGETIETLTFQYFGRVLTAQHFGMKIRKRSAGKKAKKKVAVPNSSGKGANPYITFPVPDPYDITVSIFKGTREKISGKPHNYGVPFIGLNSVPFQRKAQGSRKIEAFRSLSVPQMIENEDVHANIQTKLSTEVEKRFLNHMKRFG